MTNAVQQAARRLLREVEVFSESQDRDQSAPSLTEDILTVTQALGDLLAERGDYVLALEQIRSAPHVGVSWRERYQDCVKTADKALDAHAEKRRPRPQRGAGLGEDA